MKFTVPFKNQDSGECRSIVVRLSARDVESVESLYHTGDDAAAAYALHAAYREVPPGFEHSAPPTLVVP